LAAGVLNQRLRPKRMRAGRWSTEAQAKRPLEAESPPVAPEDLAARTCEEPSGAREADEAILVLDPITEEAIRTIATALAL